MNNLDKRVGHFLNHNENQHEKKEYYDFNSTKAPPNCSELDQLKDMLYDLVVGVKFRNHSNHFQNNLKRDIRRIEADNRMLIAADKTTNYYHLDKIEHDALLEKSLNKDYKKASAEIVRDIIAGDKKIAEELEIADRVYCTSQRQSFITLKDHKPNFHNQPSVRTLNPTKPEMGKVSKKLLENIVVNVRNASGLNQSKNTTSVIHWFRNLKNKNQLKFIQFDICEFYPSISEDLLDQALDFASDFVMISDSDKGIIKQVRKSVIYNGGTPWIKKGDRNFDVAMGSFDGAEVCELVGLFVLSKLAALGIDVGLYRDDGLGVCRLSARQTEMLKKKMCAIFSALNLKITTDVNHKMVNFLDVTLDLSTGIYKPYMKPNNTILYVNRLSNHPPAVIKNIPESVNRRLSGISCNEKVLKEAAGPYQKALQDSGYQYELKYTEQGGEGQAKGKRKNRPRNITWFNPPFSMNVSTNIGKKFLNIIRECFPKSNPLSKIINKNTIKIAYRCMPNMKSIIAKHNSAVSRDANPPPPIPPCKCGGNKPPCPLNGQCKTTSLVYKATVIRGDNGKVETYTGLTGGTFKKRWDKHNSDFRHEKNETATKLSGYIWKLKRANVPFQISWEKITNARTFNPVKRKCNLCLQEKFRIMFQPEGASLNSRKELFSTCRHRTQPLLQNFK